MDTTNAAVLRVHRFLETEPVIWLSSIRPDGAPHLVPTWFVWDGETIVIRSKPHARKVRNLAHDPRAMLALGDADDDFDVGLLEARAEVVDGDRPLPEAFVAKYRQRMAGLGLTPAGIRGDLLGDDPPHARAGARLARALDAALLVRRRAPSGLRPTGTRARRSLRFGRSGHSTRPPDGRGPYSRRSSALTDAARRLSSS